eukprot:TRINITY_DN18897_c0_g1_i1.p2 TRINITY_DN18897_c0_g1~~TRINITY_DN18897_c0_g1_i1.p2  ORF type:complete len:119 (+),score=31.18 TRINITY_DN18897_c0_g1_i1:41-397(+)
MIFVFFQQASNMSVHHVHSAAEYSKLKDAGDKLVVVDFSAVWCGPCKAIAPKFEALAAEHKDVVFIHVDVDELEDLEDGKDVAGVPTFKFFKKGEQIPKSAFSGANESKLKTTIAANK